MPYKIIEIEGVGEIYAEKLKSIGINTTSELLTEAATPKGREKIAEETGISSKLILKWANHADLFRIKGIAGQFAELLEAGGVDTVKELRHRVAENLYPRLVAINDEKHLCKRVPAVKELEKMIAEAKDLDPVLTY